MNAVVAGSATRSEKVVEGGRSEVTVARVAFVPENVETQKQVTSQDVGILTAQGLLSLSEPKLSDRANSRDITSGTLSVHDTVFSPNTRQLI